MKIEGWSQETRECQNCKHFKDLGFNQIPICSKKLMSLTRTLKVLFPDKTGTCFEIKNLNLGCKG